MVNILVKILFLKPNRDFGVFDKLCKVLNIILAVIYKVLNT